MTTKEEIDSFRSLNNMPQWKLLVQIIEQELKETEEEIFKVKSNELKFTQDDLLKTEREILKRFINLPNALIDDFENGLIEEEE